MNCVRGTRSCQTCVRHAYCVPRVPETGVICTSYFQSFMTYKHSCAPPLRRRTAVLRFMRLTSCVGSICPSPVRIKAPGRTRQKGSSAAFRIVAQGLDPLSQRIAERKNQRAKQLELKKSQLKLKQVDARDALNERQRSLQVRERVI